MMNTTKSDHISTAILSCSLAAVLCAAIAGCTTVTTVTHNTDGTSVTNTVRTVDPVRTSRAIEAIVPPAVRLAITQQPASERWIRDAQIAICALSGSDNLTPASLKAAVAGTGYKDIQSPEVQAAIEAVYGIYTAFYDDTLAQKIDANAQLAAMRVVLQSVCDSLGKGLATQ